MFIRSFATALAVVGLFVGSGPSIAASPPPTSWEIAGQFNNQCPGNQFGQPWQYGKKPAGGGPVLTPITNAFTSTFIAMNFPGGNASLGNRGHDGNPAFRWCR
jgi:hypothetical protein